MPLTPGTRARLRPARPARHRRVGVVAVCLTALLGAVGVSAKAAELVMFESPSCTWCQRWHAEIGPIYPKTDESRRAPLRRVNLHDPWPSDLRGLRAVSFTPTFVLVEAGEELGRITGYAGEDFFWFQLATVLKALPAPDGDEGR
ncbi:hypothetical protein [uncultured Rhodospira sp.]|uniref:hypothetical protein n=1 Tax=uncultured Rhodospira sp. TaxID=1936189 RepID=UPI002603FE9E|nr:hypothetical protein [uncultured Rhodospira sp.]